MSATMQMKSGHGPVFLDSSRMIGRGGEAAVYAVKGNRNMVAKVYHKKKREHEGKLRAMVGHAPADPGRKSGHISIAWPEEVLLDASGSVTGFLMPAIRDSYPFSDVYHPMERKNTLPTGFGYNYLLRTAHNLCAAVSAVHDMGYVIGDLNDSNILVHKDARVTLIDCDSFQIGPYRCLVGRPEYTAPEIQSVDLSVLDRTPEQDCFALAVLVYQLLMNGRHPYAGVGEPGELSARIRGALCPHAPGGPKPQIGTPPLEWLPPSLQKLIMAAFIDGHSAPSLRPSARTWADKLIEAERMLVNCRHDNTHQHFSHYKKCPACHVKTGQTHRKNNAQGGIGNGHPFQQPMPGLHVQTKGVLGQRITLAIVLVLIATVAHYWSPLTGTAEQSVVSPNPDSGSMKGIAGYLHRLKQVPKRITRKTESGSEIYRKHIGQDPYRQPNSGQMTADRAVKKKMVPDNTLISDRRTSDNLQTGSEIYKYYIGKDPN